MCGLDMQENAVLGESNLKQSERKEITASSHKLKDLHICRTIFYVLTNLITKIWYLHFLNFSYMMLMI